ncbi:hypothetical protein [Streptomyces cupreus]|uniref:Uncharacterized protein n=1 Tax=Streptomyces cupreus TaxID=2759956 RepID=A0A7X1J9Y9_9ACTN|nr:hypothetical protein [Streptomyces cupreus]MBC2906884.1 hypothetical protein [Streptomyces cupreus]
MLRADRATIEVEVKWSDLREAATVGAVVPTLRDVIERRKLVGGSAPARPANRPFR